MTSSVTNLMLALSVCACLTGRSAAYAADSLEAVQEAATKVTEIRAETARLNTEWDWQRDLLDSTISALSKRVENLEADKALLEASTGAVRREIEAIRTRYDAAADKFEAVEAFIGELTARLVAMRSWLPPRLSEALELPYLSLQDPSMTAGERMQFASTIVNRCSQFSKTITYGEEALEIEGLDGSRLVEVLYWGLSHAYAFDRADGRGYLGAPGRSGWVWTEQSGLGETIASLIEVYRDESQPGFIEVPARITDPFNGSEAE